MKRSALAGLLLCSLLAGGLAACTAPNQTTPDRESDSAVSTADPAVPADTEDPAETEITLAVTEADFENANWNILSYARQAEGTMWQYLDFGFLEAGRSDEQCDGEALQRRVR